MAKEKKQTKEKEPKGNDDELLSNVAKLSQNMEMVSDHNMFWGMIQSQFSSLLFSFSLICFSFFFLFIASILARGAPIDPVYYSLPEPRDIKTNPVLGKADILLDGQVFGPESLAIDPSGKVFASFKSGIVATLHLEHNHIRIGDAVQLSRDNATYCDGSYGSFLKCGRPLGLRLNEDQQLLVADAYLGLLLLDFVKEKTLTLVQTGTEISDDPTLPPLRYLNDVDVLPDGRIVVSESSTKFDDRDYILDLLEHKPNGRLLVYDPKKETLKVLIKDLYFPNGVQVYKGKVFYSEMGMTRIMKYSPSSKKSEVLVDRLPGYPDNIRLSSQGTLLVAIPSRRDKADQWLEERPGYRSIITQLFSSSSLQTAIGMISSVKSLVLEIDPTTGGILSALEDPSGEVGEISIALEDHQGNLLLGSDTNYHIARLPEKLWKK